VESVLKALRDYGLLLSPHKCSFAQPKTEFLGFEFDHQGYAPTPRHIEAIKTFPEPKNLKELRCFLGLANFFKSTIPNRAAIFAPLYRLLRKDTLYKWTADCQTAFDEIKRALTARPSLAFPDFDKVFYLCCDASKFGLGAALYQLDDKESYVPIAFCG